MKKQALHIAILLVFTLTTIKAQVFNNAVFLENGEPTWALPSSVQGSVLNKDNHLVSLLVNSESRTSNLITTNTNFQLALDKLTIVETNGNGELVWSTDFEIENNEPQSLTSSLLVLYKLRYEADHYYFSFLVRGNFDLKIDGSSVANFRSTTRDLITIEFDSQGQFSRVLRGESNISILRDYQVKHGNIYYVYSKILDNESQAECPELLYYVEVKSLNTGASLKREFTGKGFDTNADDICSDSGPNESFGIFELSVDDRGDIYLVGRIRGAYPTDLSPSIRAARDERHIVLVKLNTSLNTQWDSFINTGQFNGSHRLTLLNSGDLLLYTQFFDSRYQFNGREGTTNTSGFKSAVSDQTFALTKIDTDGNFQWVSFLDRYITDLKIIQDSEDILIGYPFDPFRTDAEGNYYDANRRESNLVNNRHPNDQKHAGFIRINSEGQYQSHMSWSLVTARRAGLTLSIFPVNMSCDEFFVSGRSSHEVDLSVENTARILIDRPNSSHFIAKYAPLPPEVELTPPNFEQCIESVYLLPFTATDELSGELRFEVNSSNESILPSDSLSIILDNPENFIRIATGTNHGSFEIILKAINECDKETEVRIPWIIKEPLAAPFIENANGPYNLCDEETIVLTASIDNPIWSNGETTKSITVTETGLYWAYAQDPSNCKSLNSDTVDVFVFKTNLKPIIEASGQTVLCEGEELILTTNLDRNIMWSTGETTQSITVNNSGTYTVFQSSARCGDGVKADPIQVEFKPKPGKPNIIIENGSLTNTNGNEIAVCEGDALKLFGPEGLNYIWSNGSTNSNIEVTSSGKYWLQVEKNGCISEVSDTIEIRIEPNFDIQIGTETTICSGTEEVLLSPTLSDPDVNLTWSNGSNAQEIYITEEGEYWLEASRGVCSKNRIYIKVDRLCIPRVYIPNAFTPNNDGFNDTFEVRSIHTTFYEIRIFNQWGTMIFNSQTKDEPWDGTYQGQEVQSGKYAYKLTYGGTDVDGNTQLFTKNGSLSIIR